MISLTYIRPIEEIDHHLEDHINYLKGEYSKGNFLASGRKVPRTGGIILANVDSNETLEKIIGRDPFKKAGLAEYDVTEFIPSMVAEGLEKLQG
ncbi:MAG: YciI family protein [Balneolaceae bacterium]